MKSAAKSSKKTTLLILGGLGAVGVAIGLYEALKKPAATTPATPSPSDTGATPSAGGGTTAQTGTATSASGGSGGNAGSGIAPIGHWTPTLTLKKNGRYRVSSDVRSLLALTGYKLYTDKDTPPSDWPTDDADPNRFRVEGVWPMADQTLTAAEMTKYGNLRVYAYTV